MTSPGDPAATVEESRPRFAVDVMLGRLASSHPLACKWLEKKRKGHIFELRVCQSLLLE